MLTTRHGNLSLPTFFPDGTKAVVRSLDSKDLEHAQVEGLVMCVYHLLAENIEERMKGVSGIHQFMNWSRPIITDSGGFQVLSLIHNNPKLGTIDDQKITFLLNDQTIILTPESSIGLQIKLGTDIAICLDDCTKPGADMVSQIQSVERTIAWAKRSKDEFVRLTKDQKIKPLLFAVIQGGADKELRTKCAEALIKIGFDGYCYGGWPVDENRVLLTDILELTAKLMPDNLPKYALGVGKPEDIVKCFKMGYQIFDCVIPTREARHKALYVFNSDPKDLDLDGDFYTRLSLQNLKWQGNPEPLSKFCDCHTCQNFSAGYLWHLFRINETSAYRLATIHNLRFYSMLMERLKAE